MTKLSLPSNVELPEKNRIMKSTKRTSLFVLCGLLLFTLTSLAQTGIIKGKVYDAVTNEGIPFANVIIQGTSQGAPTDIDGYYQIDNLEPGIMNVEVSYLGYRSQIQAEVLVSNGRPTNVDFALEESASDLEEIVVKASPFNKTEESPVSLRSIGTAEIQRNPGGNRDISKAIQTLPGVANTSSFRNDLIIRGGGPNENRFYLDDVEVPNINHFATQGAAGGPVGMINVDFIREVDFFSGAFPANRGNALSSVMNFKQKNGRDDRLGMRATLGSSDLALTLEGPLGKKTTFMASVRQSYLQFLFKLLELPFLPTYNDFHVKVRSKLNDKNEIYFVGLGAIDQFELNLDANETEEQQYFLDNLPVVPQWNYTNGLVYKHYREKGFFTFVMSRNMLNNRSTKYAGNIETEDNLLYDYTSQEIENKLRAEYTHRISNFKFNYGLNYERAKYNNTTFQKITIPTGQTTVDYSSEFGMHKYGIFAQASGRFVDDRLGISFGLRADGNDYNDEMANLISQLSPRVSLSMALTDFVSLNFNSGLYYQVPAYTILGFQDNDGVFVNRETGLDYIRNFHLVGGVELNTGTNSRITIEGYLKKYDQYPFSIVDQLNLANQGADFGVIGDEGVSSTGKGRNYGVEVLFQQRLFKGFYGIGSYTLSWSEFDDKNGDFLPSSWDARHMLNLAAGKRFKRNWEVGLNFRIQSSLPFTPYDVATSSLVNNWNINFAGIRDYDLLNSERGKVAHEMDIRVDKKWFFKKWTFNLFLDINNLYAGPTSDALDELVLDRDENGLAQIDNPDEPIDLQRYRTKFLTPTSSTAVPTIGIIVEY